MNRRPTPETDAEHAQFAMGGFTLDFCRRLENERDELRSDLEFRRGLFKLQEEQLNDMTHKRDGWKTAHDVMQKLAGDTIKQRDEAREERDQYRGMLIRLYNDLFVHHKGEAVREFKELFREENYN